MSYEVEVKVSSEHDHQDVNPELVDDYLRRNQERRQKRPRLRIPAPPPPEPEPKNKDEDSSESDSGRGVIIFQM